MTDSVQSVRSFYEEAFLRANNEHNPEKGQVRGIDKKEYDDLCKYLNGKVKLGGEVGKYAQKKLDELKYLKDCPYNKLSIEANKPFFFEAIFSREKALERQNIISYDTVFFHVFDRLEGINKYMETKKNKSK